MKQSKEIFVFNATRCVLGFMFLWAFIDKTFGLGFSTLPSRAWINGGSPTAGFLKTAVSGPFADFFHSLSGVIFVDWLFMFGLLGIGMALVLGIAMRFASWCGIIMMSLMWLAQLPPKNNPFFDDHALYILLFLWLLVFIDRGYSVVISKWWSKTAIVKKLPFLE